jgi:hypothetical protein
MPWQVLLTLCVCVRAERGVAYFRQRQLQRTNLPRQLHMCSACFTTAPNCATCVDVGRQSIVCHMRMHSPRVRQQSSKDTTNATSSGSDNNSRHLGGWSVRLYAGARQTPAFAHVMYSATGRWQRPQTWFCNSRRTRLLLFYWRTHIWLSYCDATRSQRQQRSCTYACIP